jgi:hypothetical protein
VAKTDTGVDAGIAKSKDFAKRNWKDETRS